MNSSSILPPPPPGLLPVNFNSTVLTDAGPPPSSVFLAAWCMVSVSAFAIFAVLRPAALNTERSAAAARHSLCDGNASSLLLLGDSRQRGWIIRQLFCCSWVWVVLDAVHRVCCLLIVPNTMLWRRRLLPLDDDPLASGLAEWLSAARLFINCEGQQTIVTAMRSAVTFKRVLLSDGIDSANSQCKRQWALPVSSVLPSETVRRNPALFLFPSSAEKEEAIYLFYEAGVIALLVTMCVVVGILGPLMLCAGHLTHDGDAAFMNSEEAEETAEAGGEEESQGGSQKDDTRRTVPYYDSSDADDAWLDSPEALAEEERWREYEQEQKVQAKTHRCGMQGAGGRARQRGESSMTCTLRECWPSLLAAIYGCMYAFVGGMPLLMHIIFPILTGLSIVVAMFGATT